MFRRQIEILTKEKQKKLEEKSILIIGAGGLGNVIISEMSCIGLKKIYIMDFDKIEIHNIHRQFNFNKNDIGKLKSEIIAKKMKRCNTEIIPINKKFNDFNKKIDLIIDCSDNFEVRKKIDIFAKKNNLCWLYGSVENWRGQICLFEKKDLSIFKADKNHKIDGVIPGMVGIVGSIQATIATKYLAELEIETDKLIYIEFTNELKLMKFNL